MVNPSSNSTPFTKQLLSPPHFLQGRHRPPRRRQHPALGDPGAAGAVRHFGQVPRER